MDPNLLPPEPEPSIFRWTLGFLLVGMAWGLTTPFMRRAALNYNPPERPALTDPTKSLITRFILKAFFAVTDMLRRPSYAMPFLLNVTGSVWFFLLIGKAELSLTVPITNSLAFLFTVLGEWWAEGKLISGRIIVGLSLTLADTWTGMVLVLSGIALCVYSKT